MTLPNAERAIVDPAKLRDYCLNPRHPRGKHKARVFESVIGFTANDAGALSNAIRRGIRDADCEPGEKDAYGERFTVDLLIDGPAGPASIRTGWILKANEDTPRLTTCFVKV